MGKKVSQADIDVNVKSLKESKLKYVPGGYLSLKHIKELAKARLETLNALNEAGRLTSADADTFSYKPKRGKIKWPR